MSALLAAGVLFLAGGGTTPPSVVEAFLNRVGRGRLIVVLGQVREEPPRAESSRELLIESGATMVVLLPFSTPSAIERASAETLLRSCAGIWVPGGDQGLLMDRWGTEWARAEIGGAVRRGASYFGTSAGAMLASDTMISGNGPQAGTALTRPGLALTPVLIDSHYRERNRQARTRHALKATGAKSAIGLSEGEWVMMDGGKVTVGNGTPETVSSEK